MNAAEEIDILLVEDEPGDVELTREGLAEAGMSVSLHTVDNGIKALRYLRREPPFPDAVRPDLILLDLNLPQKDGRETLKEIKSDARLKSIPVVVLSTSDSDRDVMTCYDLGANCYLTKPVGFEAFVGAMRILGEFWFALVKTPRRR